MGAAGQFGWRWVVLTALVTGCGCAQTERAQNSLAGCQIGANGSVYNTRIDQLPARGDSAVWIGNVGKAPLSIAPAWGVNVVDNSTAAVKFKFHYTPEADHEAFQTPQGMDRRRETGALTTDGNNDHHVIAINHETCRVYETYQDGLQGDGWYAASGYQYESAGPAQPREGTTDAAGLPLLPLLLHLSEIEAGAVNHAMRFTSCTGCISAANYLWPATTPNGGPVPNTPPMGARLRLKAGFDESRFSPKAQVVLTALKRYGMFLADNGLSMQIQTANDCNLDPAVTVALAEISRARIAASNFEVVDESSLMRSRSSSLVKGAAPGMAGAMVGVADPVLVFQAGAPAVQMVGWVNHATNRGLSWKMTEGPGLLTPSGVYTPPNSVREPVRVSFMASSVEDPSATAVVRGTILPAGVIRIDTGSSHPYRDGQGNTWYADTLGLDTAVYSLQDDNYPANAWEQTPDARLYQTYIYTWGDDIAYPPFLVANGRYEVKFLMARGGCAGTFNPARVYGNGLVSSPVVLEANAASKLFDIGTATHATCRVGVSETVSVLVTKNQLRVAIRAVGGQNRHSVPGLSALQISSTDH